MVGALVLLVVAVGLMSPRNGKTFKTAAEVSPSKTSGSQSRQVSDESSLSTHKQEESQTPTNSPSTTATDKFYPKRSDFIGPNNNKTEPITATVDRNAIEFTESDGEIYRFLIILTSNYPVNLGFSGYDTSKIEVTTDNPGIPDERKSIIVRYLGDSIDSDGSTTITVTATNGYGEQVILPVKVSWKKT
jgi:hypothetical protein